MTISLRTRKDLHDTEVEVEKVDEEALEMLRSVMWSGKICSNLVNSLGPY